MKKYKVRVISVQTPIRSYVPDIMLYHMDIWKIISKSLLVCGFIHVGDLMVLGKDENVFEFHLTFDYDHSILKIELDTIE